MTVLPTTHTLISTNLQQPQCITALWPVLISRESRPTEGRRLSWPLGSHKPEACTWCGLFSQVPGSENQLKSLWLQGVNLCSSVEDVCRHACPLCRVRSVTVVSDAVNQLIQKHQLSVLFQRIHRLYNTADTSPVQRLTGSLAACLDCAVSETGR